MSLKLLAINCTLKPSSAKEKSSTDALLDLLMEAFAAHDVKGEVIRAADHDIRPGVSADEGKGDAWPAIRKKVLAADILLMGTPIWLGQPSSICKRVLERLNAFLDETDDAGRMLTFGRVACVAVVGNEDGAHHVSAELYQGLNDVGFTIPAGAVSYWVGEAMGSTNFVDLKKTPPKVKEAVDTMARNASHLANLLKQNEYPAAE
ncbi:NAD(P)H-dependent oxidoreductase [Iodidimonas sp. SYSU 1G8]|uniref:flavodoxin family protein n=1 Tax=Iodidimonas sp. SYSU 1G8 TaxID=3133967 RepID=UPI0031FEC729